MTKLPVLFTALAEEDLDQIEDHIAAHDPAAAARVRAAIVKQSLELGHMHAKGMILKNPANKDEIGVRLWPVSRYRNYLILYRIEAKFIRVLRILHDAQDWMRFFGKDQPSATSARPANSCTWLIPSRSENSLSTVKSRADKLR